MFKIFGKNFTVDSRSGFAASSNKILPILNPSEGSAGVKNLIFSIGFHRISNHRFNYKKRKGYYQVRGCTIDWCLNVNLRQSSWLRKYLLATWQFSVTFFKLIFESVSNILESLSENNGSSYPVFLWILRNL